MLYSDKTRQLLTRKLVELVVKKSGYKGSHRDVLRRLQVLSYEEVDIIIGLKWDINGMVHDEDKSEIEQSMISEAISAMKGKPRSAFGKLYQYLNDTDYGKQLN